MRSVTNQREGLGKLEESRYVSCPQRLWLALQGVSRALETTETPHCGPEICPGARRGGGAVLKRQRGVPESVSGLP